MSLNAQLLQCFGSYKEIVVACLPEIPSKNALFQQEELSEGESFVCALASLVLLQNEQPQ